MRRIILRCARVWGIVANSLSRVWAMPAPVWRGLTLLALIPLGLYTLLLVYRWFRPDPQFLAFLTAAAQVVALLSLLGFQVRRSRQAAEPSASRSPLQRWVGSPRGLCLSAWLVAAVLAGLFYLSVSVAAPHYNVAGTRAFDAGQYSAAARAFRLAVSLAPGDARAHYNLGNAYEELHDYDSAIAEYQLALEQDDRLVRAYNNLGRVYLRARTDPDSALLTLLAGLSHVEQPADRAVLHKNIGQAYLEKGLPRAALEALGEAKSEVEGLPGGGASESIYLADVHRLSALAYEALNQPDEALRAWAACEGRALAVTDSEECADAAGQAVTDCLNAQVWSAEAEEHLAASTGGE